MVCHSIKSPPGCGVYKCLLDLAERNSRTNQENRFVHLREIEVVFFEIDRRDPLHSFLVADFLHDSLKHDSFFDRPGAKNAVWISGKIARLYGFPSGAEIKMAVGPHAPYGHDMRAPVAPGGRKKIVLRLR